MEAVARCRNFQTGGRPKRRFIDVVEGDIGLGGTKEDKGKGLHGNH